MKILNFKLIPVKYRLKKIEKNSEANSIRFKTINKQKLQKMLIFKFNLNYWIQNNCGNEQNYPSYLFVL